MNRFGVNKWKIESREEMQDLVEHGMSEDYWFGYEIKGEN